ncbi:MAG: ABC transporter substrate-binding protein [Chloroflexi bacterium]|nr:ABC transporter substrate-binding protein [Chloroflexota bacterium]
MAENYWGKYWRRRVSRRGVLVGGAATAAGAAGLVAVGCGDDDDDEPAPAATAAATEAAAEAATEAAATEAAATEAATQAAATEAAGGPRTGGTMKLQRAFAETGYDPAITITGYTWVALTYNHLLGYSLFEDEAWGDAAQSWEQPDPFTIVFNLEPNLRFNPEAAEGRQITSQDIAYSFARLPAAFTDLASEVNPIQFAFMAGFDMPDASTFALQMAYPWVSAIPTLGSTSLAIVAPEVVEANGGNLTDTVNAGGGAYMFESRGRDGYNAYARNPNYAGHSTARGRFTKEPPYIDRWEEAHITDPATAEARFLTGDSDILTGVVGGIDAIKADELRDQDGVNIISGPTNTHLIMALDALKWVPFPQLREALSLSIDWDGYIDVVHDGNGIRGAPVGPRFPAVLSQDEIRELQQFNPERARQLWEQGGGDQVFPDGLTTLLATFTDTRGTQFIAQSIEENLGVKVNMEPVDLATYVSSLTAPPGSKIWHFALVTENSISTIPDYNALTHYVPTGYGGAFGLFTHEHPQAALIPPEVINITHDVGKPIQDLYNAQAVTHHPEQRTALLQQLQRLIFTQFCCTFPVPVADTEQHALRTRVQNAPLPPDFRDNGSMGYRRSQNMWLADA